MTKSAKKNQATIEKVNTFRYLISKFNKEGWANVDKHLPIPFDLVTVQTSNGKTFAAWWNKTVWEGLRLKPTDKIIRWKRRKYEHCARRT